MQYWYYEQQAPIKWDEESHQATKEKRRTSAWNKERRFPSSSEGRRAVSYAFQRASNPRSTSLGKAQSRNRGKVLNETCN